MILLNFFNFISVSRSPSTLFEIYSIDFGTKREGIYLGFFSQRKRREHPDGVLLWDPLPPRVKKGTPGQPSLNAKLGKRRVSPGGSRCPRSLLPQDRPPTYHLGRDPLWLRPTWANAEPEGGGLKGEGPSFEKWSPEGWEPRRLMA